MHALLLEGIISNWCLSIVSMTFKIYFTNTVVPILNSLPIPIDAVMADNINLFKKCLDKLWSSYDFVDLFRAQFSHFGPEVYLDF